jgi:hypothetical protein
MSDTKNFGRAWADAEYEDATAADVRESGDYWTVHRSDGWTIGVPKVDGVAPRVGSRLRFWGRGIGFPVRGIAVDGVVVRYETDAEQRDRYARELAEREAAQRATFEREGRAALDARYDALPPVFRARIDRFRANNPDFRWKYEGYEMFCCEQAVVIARALGTPEAIQSFRDLPRSEQMAKVPGLDDGHSGNTFGAACVLAALYVRDESFVPQMHGAMSPLVGSVEYGDVPKDGAA